MTDSSQHRLLFVLSGDHGELSNALYFALGSGFDNLLLLPESLRTTHAELAWPSLVYRGLADVRDAVERQRPDLVLLFSGYLLGVNGLLNAAALTDLLAWLAARGIAVATSDPFLGLLDKLDDSTFSERHPHRQELRQHFAPIAALLKNVPHLYLHPLESTQVRALSFYNPSIEADATAVREQRAVVAARLTLNSHSAWWLFVLSQEDCGAQVLRLGPGGLERQLAGLFHQAKAAGAWPILVAPTACVRALQTRLGGVIHGSLLTFLDHDTFQILLLAADYAFYWNPFSNSLLPRLASARPVFFFDRGHLAGAVPALWQQGLECYYGGWALPWLDVSEPLLPEELAARASLQRRDLGPLRERFRRSPTPVEVVAQLLAHEGC